MYRINRLTPLDLISLSLDTSFIHKERVSRSEFVNKLHERIRNQIENQIKVYAACHTLISSGDYRLLMF